MGLFLASSLYSVDIKLFSSIGFVSLRLSPRRSVPSFQFLFSSFSPCPSSAADPWSLDCASVEASRSRNRCRSCFPGLRNRQYSQPLNRSTSQITTQIRNLSSTILAQWTVWPFFDSWPSPLALGRECPRYEGRVRGQFRTGFCRSLTPRCWSPSSFAPQRDGWLDLSRPSRRDIAGDERDDGEQDRHTGIGQQVGGRDA